MSVGISPDETIWTESSYKFTRQSVTGMLEQAGLEVERWMTDLSERFGLVLARPAWERDRDTAVPNRARPLPVVGARLFCFLDLVRHYRRLGTAARYALHAGGDKTLE